jgi:hypothetical protein
MKQLSREQLNKTSAALKTEMLAFVAIAFAGFLHIMPNSFHCTTKSHCGVSALLNYIALLIQ